MLPSHHRSRRGTHLMLAGLCLCMGALPLSRAEEPAAPNGGIASFKSVKRLEHAGQLAAEGKQEEALAEYLWLFDEGAKNEPSFSGVRLSFLLMQMKQLANVYPPAQAALEERRDLAELALGDKALTMMDGQEIMDLVALNNILGLKDRNRLIQEKLRASDAQAILPFVDHMVENDLAAAANGNFIGAPPPAPSSPSLTRHRDVGASTAPPIVARRVVALDAASSGGASADPPPAPYLLDTDAFTTALATADPVGRAEILRRRWDQVRGAVVYADVMLDVAFFRSCSFWQSGLSYEGWALRAESDWSGEPAAGTNGSVIIAGDCTADLSVPNGGFVHILGDLQATLTVNGQSEVVIGGDVGARGRIDAGGIARFFIGGSVEGAIRSAGSLEAWVHGDYPGELSTGTPLTAMHVMGDVTGPIQPLSRGSLVRLDIHGDMPSAALLATVTHGYTQFVASIGSSDMEPGLYDAGTHREQARWVIHRSRPH